MKKNNVQSSDNSLSDEDIEIFIQTNLVDSPEEAKSLFSTTALTEAEIDAELTNYFVQKNKRLSTKLLYLGIFLVLGYALYFLVTAIFGLNSIWQIILGMVLIPVGFSLIALKTRKTYQLAWLCLSIFIWKTFLPTYITDAKLGVTTVISTNFYADTCQHQPPSQRTFQCFVIPEANMNIKRMTWHDAETIRAINVTYYPQTKHIYRIEHVKK